MEGELRELHSLELLAQLRVRHVSHDVIANALRRIRKLAFRCRDVQSATKGGDRFPWLLTESREQCPLVNDISGWRKVGVECFNDFLDIVAVRVIRKGQLVLEYTLGARAHRI